MRITSSVVQFAADAASELSDGWFHVSVGGDIGHGTRYIAGHRQLVWVGRGANVQAVAFYLGVINGYGSITSAGPRLRSILLEASQRRDFAEWYAMGMHEAKFRQQTIAERAALADQPNR